jgi:predicted HicB family RNase H-like nuclease
MVNSKSKPRKHPDKVLAERLELRITTGERRAYEQAAKKAKLSVSEWIRDCLSKATGRGPKGS